ncbi:MAG TPA: hypothetical protein VK468_08645 [Pyrinomonadaceae bacterium]|nr:hypothetical protein [Pyrinomonadaceae bacterium]
MEAAENLNTLAAIPLGGRLLVRSRTTWRAAVVCRIADDKITLSISSSSGRNYRLRRGPDTELGFDGRIPFLRFEPVENWRDNFSSYDLRW